jgi:hypothetical protein
MNVCLETSAFLLLEPGQSPEVEANTHGFDSTSGSISIFPAATQSTSAVAHRSGGTFVLPKADGEGPHRVHGSSTKLRFAGDQGSGEIGIAGIRDR